MNARGFKIIFRAVNGGRPPTHLLGGGFQRRRSLDEGGNGFGEGSVRLR